MKFSFGIVTLGLIALTSVAAEPTAIVVTRLHVPEPLPDAAVKTIEAALDVIKPKIDEVIGKAVEYSENGTRNLRGDRNLSCVHCPHVVPSYPICFVGGVARDRCTRQLSLHSPLSDADIMNLTGAELEEYLKRVEICDAAVLAVKDKLAAAEKAGELVIPAGANFVEQCFYE